MTISSTSWKPIIFLLIMGFYYLVSPLDSAGVAYAQTPAIQKRNRVMIPSIVALSVGIPLTVIGCVFQSLDGQPSGQLGCGIGLFEGGPCKWNFKAPAPVVMIVVGVSFTIGGATGLGISLGRASQQSSPAP